jgi:hypothetical protein
MTLLYKYTSLKGALSILQNNSIGFSSPKHLNDPFELKGTLISPIDACIKNNGEMYANLAERFGVLSLTRTHLNPIMWSLYSEQHMGAVITFDVEMAEFNRCAIIPASKGSVIYSRTHPSKFLDPCNTNLSEARDIFHALSYDELSERGKEIVSMYFLHKGDYWGHEEEVRVVKNLSHFENKSDQWSKVDVEGRPLHCLRLPVNSIVHIYLGARFFEIRSQIRNHHLSVLHEFISYGYPVSTVKMKDNSWELMDDHCYGIDDGYFI